MDLLQLLEALGHSLVDLLDVVLVDCKLLENLLLIRNSLLLHLAQLICDLVLHELLHVSEDVLRSFDNARRDEDECLERVLEAVRVHDFLNEEVELLFFLVQEARAKALDALICHTHLCDQEVEQHNLHHENVGDEEEPRHCDHSILVVVLQVPLIICWLAIRVAFHFVWNPLAVLGLRQVADRVPERLQIIYEYREWLHVLVAFEGVTALEDVRDEDEDGAESEEHDQERVDVLRHLDKHFNEEAESVVVPDQLQQPQTALDDADYLDDLKPKALRLLL